MKQLQYEITLRQPVYARALGGDPNSGMSLDYVPGSLMRGVLLFKYAEKNGIDIDKLNAADTAIRKLFFNGETRFLNAYPVYEKQRALPVPQSWQQTKFDKINIYDFAVAEPTDEKIARDCRGIRASFWCEANQQKYLVKPERVLAVHNRRNREYGRAMELENMENKNEDKGEVFRYEALAPNQVFLGLILCEHASDAKTLHDLLSGEIFLGGSRAAGYGLAQLAYLSTSDFEREVESNWPNPLPETLTFTLLSDALIRDGNGQFSADAETLKFAICQRLSIAADLVDNKIFLRSNIVGGFNRKWGLPLAQNVAVSMGGVITLTSKAWNSTNLENLEKFGIGERRAEGFGRIAVNWNLMDKPFQVQAQPVAPRITIESNKPAPQVKGEAALKLAQQMALRIFRQTLEEKLVAWTHESNFDGPSRIRKAQIFRLRNVVQNALHDEKLPLNRVNKFLKDIESRDSVKKQFENTYCDGKTLLKWLKDIANDGKSPWQKLEELEPKKNGQPSKLQPPAMGAVAVKMNDKEIAEMGTEYLLRYIDLMLAKLAKEVQS